VTAEWTLLFVSSHTGQQYDVALLARCISKQTSTVFCEEGYISAVIVCFTKCKPALIPNDHQNFVSLFKDTLTHRAAFRGFQRRSNSHVHRLLQHVIIYTLPLGILNVLMHLSNTAEASLDFPAISSLRASSVSRTAAAVATSPSLRWLCCLQALSSACLFPPCFAPHTFGYLHTFVNKHQCKCNSYLRELFAQCAVCASVEGVIVYKRNSQSQLFKILVGRFQIPPLHCERRIEGGGADVCVCVCMCVFQSVCMSGELFQSEKR